MFEVLANAYSQTPVGQDAWVLPSARGTLDDFQVVVAAAEAWEMVRHIQILEIREDRHTGRRLINALRFRRLK